MTAAADNRELVLLVHQSSDMYGSDKVLFMLARGLLTQSRFHPVVVLPMAGPLFDALTESGVEVHVGEVAKVSRAIFTLTGAVHLVRSLRRSIRVLDRIVAGRSVAVVHSNTLAVLAGAGWSVARRKRHLWHVHEILVSPKLVAKSFPRLVSWASHRVMSNSKATEKWLLSEQPQLGPRSVVVCNGLPEVLRPKALAVQRFRQCVGASDKDVVVTLVGRINRMKGHQVLLDAAAALKVRADLPKIVFVIVGGPAPGLEKLPDQLKVRATEAGLADRVHFLPFEDDVWPVWFGSDIAVVPSIEPESFGMVAIEAMAAGVPVVASGHGGILDIVCPERTGLLVPPGDALSLADALARLAGDSGLRKEMGRAGAERQRQSFSVESQISRTIGVYEEMVQ